MAKPVYVWDGSNWQQVASSGVDFAAYVLASPPIRPVSGADTLQLSDAGRIVEANLSSPATLTIYPYATRAYPIGMTVRILQTGSSPLTVAGDVGVTVHSLTGTKTNGQWSEALLTQLSQDVWVISGDLTA